MDWGLRNSSLRPPPPQRPYLVGVPAQALLGQGRALGHALHQLLGQEDLQVVAILCRGGRGRGTEAAGSPSPARLSAAPTDGGANARLRKDRSGVGPPPALPLRAAWSRPLPVGKERPPRPASASRLPAARDPDSPETSVAALFIFGAGGALRGLCRAASTRTSLGGGRASAAAGKRPLLGHRQPPSLPPSAPPARPPACPAPAAAPAPEPPPRPVPASLARPLRPGGTCRGARSSGSATGRHSLRPAPAAARPLPASAASASAAAPLRPAGDSSAPELSAHGRRRRRRRRRSSLAAREGPRADGGGGNRTALGRLAAPACRG